MYILLAILAFGVLIFVHELGHFLAAKSCGVKVTEFSMGMGPVLLKKQGLETQYSLRLFPVGGFCAMEGEDEASEDPRAFVNQRVWKRLLILVAGSAMNFLLGLVLVICLYAGASGFFSPTIAGFYDDCPYKGTLQAGDRILQVNGERIYFAGNFSQYAAKDQDGTIDLTVRRDGKKLCIKDYPMVPVEYKMDDGTTEWKYGLFFEVEEKTVVSTLRYSFWTCMDYVRMVREGLASLLSGRASVKDMTGVVGIVDIMNEAGQSAETTSQGVENVIDLVGFIAVNLAVMNMLPLPALDGGHVLTILLTALLVRLTGKKPDPRIEGYIHYVGLLILLVLMAFIMFQDIARIVLR